MRAFNSCAFLVVVLIAASANASDPTLLEKALRSEFQGKVLRLRGFPTDENLTFSADLKPSSQTHSGSWTVAEMEIEKIQSKNNDDLIEISGKRVGYAFDEKTKALVKIKLGQNVKIKIIGPFASTSEDLVKRIRDTVFTLDINDVSAAMPDPWKAYLQKAFTLTVRQKGTGDVYIPNRFLGADNANGIGSDVELIGHLNSGEPLYLIRKGIKPPKKIHTPNPSYSEIARSAAFRGTSVLSVVVRSNGSIADIDIVKPLGLGLDEQAVAVVRTWKFQPATKDGSPVACLINVEVNFNFN